MSFWESLTRNYPLSCGESKSSVSRDVECDKSCYLRGYACWDSLVEDRKEITWNQLFIELYFLRIKEQGIYWCFYRLCLKTRSSQHCLSSYTSFWASFHCIYWKHITSTVLFILSFLTATIRSILIHPRLFVIRGGMTGLTLTTTHSMTVSVLLPFQNRLCPIQDPLYICGTHVWSPSVFLLSIFDMSIHSLFFDIYWWVWIERKV